MSDKDELDQMVKRIYDSGRADFKREVLSMLVDCLPRDNSLQKLYRAIEELE